MLADRYLDFCAVVITFWGWLVLLFHDDCEKTLYRHGNNLMTELWFN